MIERAFKKIFKNEGTLYLACNDKNALFTSIDNRGYELSSCQNICDALSYLADNICAPLVADLFLFCYERDFMTSLSDDNQADIIEAFN